MAEQVDHARVAVPPPLVFLFFLLAALGLNVALPLPAPWLAILRPLGGVAVLAGVLLGPWAVSRMRKYRTSPSPDKPTAVLITDGPYGIMRNPIYVGFTLIVIGFSLVAGTLWGLLLAPFLIMAATRLVVVHEEEYLASRFGQRYEDYRSRVRRWL
ncbi:MAG TPA: isoprenylcysteine carboxylmethyltransferase family protein [Anaerolineales bacterium]